MSEASAQLTAEDSPGGIFAGKRNTKGNEWVDMCGNWNLVVVVFKGNSNFE